MPQFISSRRRRTPTVAAFVLVMLASLCLAACGSSSNSPSTSTSTNASSTTSSSTTSTSTTAKAKGASRFAALRECLQKNGITLPKRPTGGKPSSGGKRPPTGGFLGGGAGATPKLPAGVTRAQYDAAIKKCGGFGGHGGFPGGAGARFSSPAAKQALAKFAACLRTNGVNVPAPNTSGKGPIFNTKGLDTSSPKFAAAESKCRSDLQGVFSARPGAGGAGGAPPAGSAG
jgi:hypothetical protein